MLGQNLMEGAWFWKAPIMLTSNMLDKQQSMDRFQGMDVAITFIEGQGSCEDGWHLVSCPAGNNLWKIRLVTLCAFLGLLHMSAGFERSRRWPYMNVLTSTWLQLSPISIPTSARAPVGRLSNWTYCNLIDTFK